MGVEDTNQMRIATTGAQAVGKSTFVKDFLRNWPNYTTPKKTYRDLVKKKGLKINKEGTKDSQMAITTLTKSSVIAGMIMLF